MSECWTLRSPTTRWRVAAAPGKGGGLSLAVGGSRPVWRGRPRPRTPNNERNPKVLVPAWVLTIELPLSPAFAGGAPAPHSGLTTQTKRKRPRRMLHPNVSTGADAFVRPRAKRAPPDKCVRGYMICIQTEPLDSAVQRSVE